MDIKEQVARLKVTMPSTMPTQYVGTDLAGQIIPLVRADTLKEIKKDIKHLGYATVAKELGISLQLVRADCLREIADYIEINYGIVPVATMLEKIRCG
ncbi:hypothetical protein LCGC14_2712590, partial [marine sediment metagenome]